MRCCCWPTSPRCLFSRTQGTGPERSASKESLVIADSVGDPAGVPNLEVVLGRGPTDHRRRWPVLLVLVPRGSGNGQDKESHAKILSGFMAENLKIFANVIRKIPRGKVATYGQVAAAAGFPRAARQVVWALRAFRGLPWHRVVGAGGAIRVPGEQALEQRMLLELEGVAFRGRRVHLKQHQWRRS